MWGEEGERRGEEGGEGEGEMWGMGSLRCEMDWLCASRLNERERAVSRRLYFVAGIFVVGLGCDVSLLGAPSYAPGVEYLASQGLKYVTRTRRRQISHFTRPPAPAA